MAKKEQIKKEMDASVSIKLSSEVLEKARAKSKETGVTLSFIVRKALEEWVKDTAKAEKA